MGDDGASIVARNQKWRMTLGTARWWSVVVGGGGGGGGDGPMLKCTKAVNVDLDAFPHARLN